MKKTHAIQLLAAVIVMLLAVSCGGRSGNDAALQRADSLLRAGEYDSTRYIVDNIDTLRLNRRQLMHYRLTCADLSNQLYEPLPPDSVMQQLTDYYETNGTPNEQMRAYYLRGRASYTRGEIPIALDFYNKAIEHADTTRKDCDYPRMAIVYSQQSEILSSQDLPSQSLDALSKGEKCALSAKDTALAVILYEVRSNDYLLLNKIDTAIAVLKNTYKRFKQCGLDQDAAISLGSLCDLLIRKGRIDEAGSYMQIYEQESGLFDKEGNISEGHELYYYIKGMYLTATNRYKEAEIVLRKNLSTDKPHLLEAYARGLSRLYEHLNQSDSALKYANIAIESCDKRYHQNVTERLQSMMASYNFSRYQQEAGRQAIKAAQQKYLNVILMISFLAIVSSLLFILFHFHQRARARQLKQEEEKRQLSDRLEKEKEDLRMIQQQRYDEMQKDKNDTIAELEDHLKQYHLIRSAKRKESFETKNQRSEAIKQLCNSSAIVLLNREASKPSPDVSEAHWKSISREFDKALPAFMQFIISTTLR